MSFPESQVKGSILVGSSVPGAASMTPLPAGADGDVLTVDSTTPTGLKYAPPAASSSVDPRDIFRYSMFHNVGVTGGG
jgi:hypothetical protein